MSTTKKFKDVKCGEGFLENQGRWTLTVGDKKYPTGTEWEASSPFGSVETAVVVGGGGEPIFDRPLCREAPNVNCVVWGKDKKDKARFAIIRQPRPHADDPEVGKEEHKTMVFGQIVMGFLERIIGKDMITRYESIQAGASREAAEEAGASVIKNIEQPSYPWHNPNPTFVATWSDLLFVEIDLSQVEELKKDRNEPIYSAEYITAEELRERIANGKDSEGAVYRMCTANSAWFIFFCTHPELFT